MRPPSTSTARAQRRLAEPVLAGDVVGNLAYRAFDGATAWGPTLGGQAAQIRVVAAEPWSASAHGALLTLETTTAGSASTPTERLRVDATGNVGIGTTTPNSPLHVLGRSPRPTSPGPPPTITAADSVIAADTSGGAFTVTLPSAVGLAGRQYTIKKNDASPPR